MSIMAFEALTIISKAGPEKHKGHLNEAHFLAGLERLRREGAGELAQRWEQDYDNLHIARAKHGALKTFFEKFASFEKKREEALFSMEVPAGLDQSIVAEIKDFDINVVLSFRNPSLFQGNGATAEVYEVLGHPGICVKFITDQARYNENNHIRVEFGFLNAVRNVQSGRVRSPKPYFLRIHPRDGHSYGMERVDGASLSQLLEKPQERADLITVAKLLDRTQIIQEFKGFVMHMHELGVTHNDIAMRNIMLDREGKLFLIDYGKARRNENENAHAMRCESDLASLESELSSFFQEIDKLA